MSITGNRVHAIDVKTKKEVCTFGRETTSPVGDDQSNVSCCYNGKEFIYSFAFDENLYVLSEDFQFIRKLSAGSKYIDGVSIPEKVPTDMNLAVKMICELPYYGHIIYDEYRQLYYRIAYPKQSLQKEENLFDLIQSGRNRFSVLILDKDLNLTGETQMPDNCYRSNLYYVRDDGLYISTNHYNNPDFDEDGLRFEKFIVTDTSL